MLVEAVDRLERFGDRVSRQDLHPQRGAQLGHHRGRFHPMADDVTDDEHQPIPERDRIEPVAAGRGVLRGHQILRGHIRAGGHRHRRCQQRLLHDGGGVAHVAVPLGQLLEARFGGHPVAHPVGDVDEGELHALDRAVVAAARRDDEIEEVLLGLPHAFEVGLYPPFRSRLRLTGLVNPVEHLEDLLALQLGIHLAGKQPDRVDRRTERAVGGVDRDESMVWPFQADQQRGDVVEDAAHVIGRADDSVPVLFGHHLALLAVSVRCDRGENRVNRLTNLHT